MSSQHGNNPSLHSSILTISTSLCNLLGQPNELNIAKICNTDVLVTEIHYDCDTININI